MEYIKLVYLWFFKLLLINFWIFIRVLTDSSELTVSYRHSHILTHSS